MKKEKDAEGEKKQQENKNSFLIVNNGFASCILRAQVTIVLQTKLYTPSLVNRTFHSVNGQPIKLVSQISKINISYASQRSNTLHFGIHWNVTSRIMLRTPVFKIRFALQKVSLKELGVYIHPYYTFSLSLRILWVCLAHSHTLFVFVYLPH